MSERISVDSKEFKAFLAENQQLIERYRKLMDRLEVLKKNNRELEDKFRLAQEKANLLEPKIAAHVQEADETLRKARANIARLMEASDQVFSE